MVGEATVAPTTVQEYGVGGGPGLLSCATSYLELIDVLKANGVHLIFKVSLCSLTTKKL
jgi:hypothetical protein